MPIAPKMAVLKIIIITGDKNVITGTCNYEIAMFSQEGGLASPDPKITVFNLERGLVPLAPKLQCSI